MTLNNDTKKRFRAVGHALKPVVTVAGNGLSESVNAELERALLDHELIKIKISVEDREERNALIDEICRSTKSILIQKIGKVILIYREAEKPKVHISNAR
jgi:RNA-binding protein